MLKRFTGTFIAGLLALLPMLVTIGLVVLIVTYIIKWFGPESPVGRFMNEKASVQLDIHPAVVWILSLIAAIALIWFIGWFTKRVAGKRITQLIEHIVSRIPFLSKIYKSVDQVVDLIAGKGENAAAALSNVVLVRLANTRLIGMLAETETIPIDGVDHFFVYIPSAPMPTSGFNYLVPCDDVVDVNISVEELSKIIVSLGSLGPSVMNEKDPLILPSISGTKTEAAALPE